MDEIATFLGNLARPFAIYASCGALFYALHLHASDVVVGVLVTGVGGLYGAKVVENHNDKKATVELAKVQAGDRS